MLGYEYTSPTADELTLRRQQLDATGFQAWLSPIVLLFLSYIVRRLFQQISADSSSSNRHTPKPPSTLQHLTRRLTWLLTTPAIPEFGPLYVPLLGLSYLVWLVYLAVRHTSNDYLHLTKSLGHVAASQLPFQYLLALKSPNSPVTLATGLTHERVNALHRLFGRMVHLLLAGHAVLYLRFFVEKGLLGKRVGDWDVRLGLMAFWSVNALAVTALPGVRRWAYHGVFYRVHIVVSALLLGVLWLHVRYTRVYVAQAAVFWFLNGWMRWRSCVDVNVEVQKVVGEGGDGLLRVVARVVGESDLKGWVPGQHVYLRMGGTPALLERKNPFTIVDVDPSGKQVTLVVRKLAGMTADLANWSSKHAGSSVRLEGPYGEAAMYLPGLLNAGKSAGQILLVAGGVGATYTVPIFLALLRARGNIMGIKMLWFVKRRTDADWALELLIRAGQPVDVDIYVTQEQESAEKATATNVRGATIHALQKRPELATVLEPILAAKSDDGDGPSLVSIKTKRDPRSVKRNYDRISVLSCGPSGLTKSLRHEVGKHVEGYGRDVGWYEEQFGFGGS